MKMQESKGELGVLGASQGHSHKGMPHPQYLACCEIYHISIVLINVILVIELQEFLICQQIRPKQSLFVSNLGLWTPLAIFYSFTPGASLQK